MAATALQNDIPHRAREAIQSLRSDADDGYDKLSLLVIMVDLLFCNQLDRILSRMVDFAIHSFPNQQSSFLARFLCSFWAIFIRNYHGDLKFMQ